MEERGGGAAGLEALRRLKAMEAPLFLSPSQDIAEAARIASGYLFSALKGYNTSCPIHELVTDGFDAEQIWPQIEAQSEPLIKILKSQIRKFEKNPDELEKDFSFFTKNIGSSKRGNVVSEEGGGGEIEGIEEDEEEEEEEEEELEGDDEEEEEDEEEEDGEGEDEEEEEGDGLRDVEDKFLKIKELERYLEEDEAREYGIEKEKKRKRREEEEEEDEDEDEDDEDEEEEDGLGLMEMDDLEDDGTGNAKYEDFFGGKKKSKQKKTYKQPKGSDDLDLDESPNEGSDDSDLDERPSNRNTVEKKDLSTHERAQENLRSQIEDMERANLEPKDWMMQGEVTAGKRAKNSALEVDIDFEHNVRPAPVITEEVTASLEELIQKRILEGRFNDVQKPLTLVTRAPKEMKEMDENKSKKGLAEVYEEEYVQKTGLVATALSFSDEQKKEASTLFKKLCLKLDALSHFHFTPKPVIEDMSIQANVPALAMEEIAPLAVSDAAMLAPEEVFSGKGDIKEQTELTQDERKRRRAKKKRKFKAESEKRMAGKAEQGTMPKDAEGNEAS